MSTEEGNKLIAEFMGEVFNSNGLLGVHCPNGDIDYVFPMDYHSSWDWLMPCFKKFNDMVQSQQIEHDYESSAIHDALEIAIMKVNIVDAHKYFSQLIQWYNQQSSQ